MGVDRSVLRPELLAELERLNLEKQKATVAPRVPPKVCDRNPPMNEGIDDAGSGSSVSGRSTRGLKLELEGANTEHHPCGSLAGAVQPAPPKPWVDMVSTQQIPSNMPKLARWDLSQRHIV